MLKATSIINKLKSNLILFEKFEGAYLFGSILYSATPHDVDFLLIYTIHPKKTEVENLYEYLYNLLELPIDITFLSVQEEMEIEFVKKLNNTYIRIK